LAAVALAVAVVEPGPLRWTSADRYRVLLTVDPHGSASSHSPARVELDLCRELAAQGGEGTPDDSTIEVVAYDATGELITYDPSRPADERHLLPWRVEKYYPLCNLTLSFTRVGERAARYAVYFDTAPSAKRHPERYPGLVGDGDWFMQGYGRREVAACAYDTFADIDGDGDLDLLKGGTEPFIYVYENVGHNRFVERGKLTSGGKVLALPSDGSNRAWFSVDAFDWDGDGDLDLFVHFASGPYAGEILRYENTTVRGQALTFTERGPLRTASGIHLDSAVTFVDWDGDGRIDVLSSADQLIAFHKNTGASRAVADMQLADGVYVEANGMPIQINYPRVDVADIDGDGDLDLFVGAEDGRIYLFENVGTRQAPRFGLGRMIVYYGFMDAKANVKVADFDGDGLLDLVVGRYWERLEDDPNPRIHGRLYKNVGTRQKPRFEVRDASSGAPFTEALQRVDVCRQNSVRAVDWDNDGRTDLIAGDTDGYVWLFRNLTSALAPLFDAGVRLDAGSKPLRVYGEQELMSAGGYARPAIADWNNDGRKDLLVADGRGWLTLYLNQGTDAHPVLAAGQRVLAAGKPIDGTGRASVLVTDWDGDGKKDVILGMVGEDVSANYAWPHINEDPRNDRGFLFYKNIGSDASPVLTTPRWIKAGPAGGKAIDFERPNLGAYIDWDGDGVKDFIACEFERDVRLFKGTGFNPVRHTPQFALSEQGQRLVEPETAQTVSGADAIDWNRDGDVDILTGQGHAGSGLRFYEHDYLEDVMKQTSPVVSIYRPTGPVAWMRSTWRRIAGR
jgi:FG-GAP-like repeat